MKAPIRLNVISVVFLLALLLGTGSTQAQAKLDSNTPQQITSSANFPWSSRYVHQRLNPPLDVGGYVSMAISSFNDFLVMSYYDATDHSLILASPVLGHIGNCGTYNNFVCIILDGGVGLDAGMYSSIDIWGNSLDSWKMGVSYYDVTHRALKAAIYTCYLGACGWDIVTVNAPDSVDVTIGLYPSFKFDSTGNAAIASFSYNSSNHSNLLIYSYQVPSGGNCGEGGAVGLWECSEATYGSGESRYASLDFSYDDAPYIAFYAAQDGDLSLLIKGGMCGPEIGWTCHDLDGYDGSDVGYYASLQAPHYPGDLYRVAYYDKTNEHLKYYDPSWGALVVDDMGTSLSPMGISMEIDNEGSPIIAYQQISSEFSPPTLNLARPYLEYTAEPYGNCGDNPPGFIFAYWFCRTIDNGGQYTEEANYAALAINSRGMVDIAYSEYDSFYDATSVKFSYQTLFPTFLPLTLR